ncbi:Arylsulfatase [Pontiella desulfatans]|uniref:Arylsulfatase n=1 Tax=Pontiella desulfatans TaxID=2750659 RepID=A0A6C2TZQ7_PONDE|nr:sulfatase-like hydrolase/transferase [Pontiella desulfatans]SPS73739.1 sulfatase S1_27 [Kiritimatiellales bacterium]VGO13107.1 Arylsulfatase [Pontiella desulfatans]
MNANTLTLRRRSFLSNLGALALPLTINKLYAASNVQKPNVLFVLTDQWRYSAFSHADNGDALVKTPCIDQFASEGTRWRRSYSTTPVCTPERATLVTGRYAHQHGAMQNNRMLPPGNRCLAEIFRQAGYATHYTGKTHYDGEGRYDIIDPEGNTGWIPGDSAREWRRRGFQTYQGFNRGHQYITTNPSDVAMFDDDGRVMTEVLNRYEPEFQRELAEDFIRAHRTRPWLCYLSWGPPHTPYNEVPSAYKTYTVTAADRRSNVSGNTGASNLALYFAQCMALDDQFGQLMQFLENEGLKDNTLVVFTSDHGDMHYSHNLTDKSKPEEESVRVPLIMRLPGTTKPGHVSEVPIGGVDVMPTLLGLCGLPVPKTCAGVNKANSARGSSMPEIDSIYCVHNKPWRAVVTDRYKLILRDSTAPLTINSVNDLYDLVADPYELNNLKDDPAHATIKQQLFDRILQWISETDDPYPGAVTLSKFMYTN